MDAYLMVLQILIGFVILNVWLFRSSKPTNWRGGSAKTLREEFEVYGLPHWFMNVVGTVKVALAIMLAITIWYPYLAVPAAIGIAILMGGAVAMHIKIKDPLLKSAPAFTMMTLCLAIIALRN